MSRLIKKTTTTKQGLVNTSTHFELASPADEAARFKAAITRFVAARKQYTPRVSKHCGEGSAIERAVDMADLLFIIRQTYLDCGTPVGAPVFSSTQLTDGDVCMPNVLADFNHLCDSLNIDFESVTDRAGEYYRADCEEESD